MNEVENEDVQKAIQELVKFIDLLKKENAELREMIEEIRQNQLDTDE